MLDNSKKMSGKLKDSSKNIGINKIVMFLLASFPILNIYVTPFILSWGEAFFISMMIVCYLRDKRNIFNFPKWYFAFWIYVSFMYLLLSLSEFRLGVLIPGGFNFFLFSLILGFVISHFDYPSFRKYYRSLFFISFAVLVAQEIAYNLMGFRFSAMIPFGELKDGYPMEELIADQTKSYTDRSSSIFREPAHMAQYILPLLAIELYDDSKKRIFSPMSILLMISLLTLRSGNGIVGMALLVGIKFVYFIIRERTKNKFLVISLAVLIGGMALTYYVSSEAGQSVLDRSEDLENEEDAHSFVRIYRGWRLYAEMPIVYQMIGATKTIINATIPQTSASMLFLGDDSDNLYFNGMQTTFLYNGLFGTFLLLLIYIRLYKKNTILGKALIWMLLVLSLIASTYITSVMLFCTSIAEIEKHRRNEKNSLLYKT